MAIDPQFTAVVNYLVSKSQEIADGTFGNGQRPWLNFDDIKKVGSFDFAGLHEIFTRQASNDEYAKLRQKDSAEAKDVQTTKLSADFLAGMERDIRMRRRSRIRMFVHAGNRAAANGNGDGPLQQNTINWLGRLLGESKS